jgi:small-conductance mechanosensitive channel
MKWLEQMLDNNTPADWLAALLVAVGVLFFMLIFKRVIVRYAWIYAKKTDTELDDLFASTLLSTRTLLLLPLAVYAGGMWLTLPPRLDRIIEHIVIIVLLIQAALWGNSFILNWMARTMREKKEQDAAAVTTLSFIGFIARVALWAIIFLLTLDNLGFNITALLAGLGIGGVAVALAAQNILGDLFASLSIVLDKPFVIGDFIIVGEQLGTVEHIGLKTTRIRSLGGEQVVFSNTDLLNSRIKNYKRMNERRVLFTFGVVYQTSHEKLQKIPGMLRAIIEAHDKTRFDRAHFKDYGDSSLNFEVVYYVLNSDYNMYMDIQQSINLAMFERFQSEGIDFAYPTRTLYLTPAAGDAHA